MRGDNLLQAIRPAVIGAALMAAWANSGQLGIATAADGTDKSTHALQSKRRVGQIDRVTVVLEVGGHVIGKMEGKVDREKMAVRCDIGYDERTLQTPGDTVDRCRSARHYRQAAAEVRVGEFSVKPSLPAERRLVIAQTEGPTAVLYSPHGPMTRDELELIDVQGNSLLLDGLLPERPVATGDRWQHGADLMAAMLGLEKVASAEVESTLSQITAGEARIEMAGRVEGAIYGVTTAVDVKARYRFNRQSGRIDWFAMLVTEKRNASPVADGVEATARVQMQIEPQTSPPDDASPLSDAALRDLALQPTDALLRLAYRSAQGDWQFTYDRCWHVYRDHPAGAVLRMMDRGELIAQCNVAGLPKLPADKPVTLEKFQGDVRQALGKSFGKFVEADDWRDDAGQQVFRVTARGTVAELPIQWDYYLLHDRQGRRVVFTFTVEDKLVERLGPADRALVGSFRFAEASVASR